jgi:Peptidase family M28/PA domain
VTPTILPVFMALHALLIAQTIAPDVRSADVRSAMDKLRKDRFRAHMAFLADDLLEGRGTGARGHELAARYVGAQFEGMGLKPAGTDNTFYQRVPLLEISVETSKCGLTLMESGIANQLKWGQDFIMPGNPAKVDVSVEAPVVFVGYGVKSGAYDDYAGTDVQGKIVALLDGAPASLVSEMRAHAGSTREKLRMAGERGAVGMLVLRPPEAERMLPWERWVIGISFPSMRWIAPDGEPSDAFAQVQSRARLSEAVSEAMFRHAPKSWHDVLEDAKASHPQAFALPLTVRLHEVSSLRKVSSPNVVAVLPGADARLSHEYVVYSAHTDHLGIGPAISGDSIYNGAADDASGTAALLVIAEAFRSLKKPPARSILFLAATAEEKGLLGSDYFANFPTVPRENIVADINMDGASIFYTFDEVVAIGAADSTLDRVVERNAARLGLKVVPDPEPGELALVRNDQYSFVRQGIPSLMITEGEKARGPAVDAKKLNEEWTRTRYHAPSDDMNQPMNLDAAVEFMQIDFLVGYDIAQDPKRPAWKPGDFFGETFSRR